MAGEDLSPLIARARAGDRAALEAVLASVAPAVHRFGLRMCRNVHDAEDVLQDTLVAITAHLGEFEGRSSLSSWVFALTRSACARRRRGLANKPKADIDRLEEPVFAGPSPEAQVADQELASALSAALDGLSDEHREVILLRDVEGLTAPEAASAIGISVDALKSRLHRAREALRAELRPVLEPRLPARTTCPDVVALWSKKLEGDLSASDCSAMEEHLLGCPACGAACHALKRALLACQHVQSGPIAPEVQAKVKAAVRAWAGPLAG